MPTIAESLRRSTFWKTSIPMFLLAAMYPVALVSQYGWEHAQPWLNNDLAFTVFVLWVFPLMVGLTASALLPGVWRQSSSRLRRVLRGTGALLLIAAAVVTVHDIKRVNRIAKKTVAPEPMNLADRSAIQLHERLRTDLRQRYQAYADARLPEDKAQAEKDYETARVAAAALYTETYPSFDGFTEATRRSSVTGWVKFLLNVVIAATLALIFLALVGAVMLRLRHPARQFNTDPLLLTYCLGCLWFPTRLYTEWYVGFFSLDRLDVYPAFYILFVLATVGLVLMVIVVKPDRLSVTMPSITAALGVAFSAIAWAKPSMLWYVGRIMETLDMWLFLVLAVIVVTPLAAIAVVTANSAMLNSRTVPE